ncbi:MAG: hypothetical protein FJZ10_02765 [Candidatus Omnitrophica bacterium]|nr:hypothetical protein [Candidatus Omnitrophota bacterium]
MVPKWIKPFYIFAGLVDAIFGILFVSIPLEIFKAVNIPPPNHLGYIQFSGCLLIVFGIMFFNIAANPVANRNLIIYGVLLKISYCSVVFSYWLTKGLPSMWVYFAFMDLGFLLMFLLSAKALKKT